MKKCIAFRPVGVSPRAWIPCGRRAVKHSPFCKQHADAMNGAVLGLWVKRFFEPAEAGEPPSNGAAKQKNPEKNSERPARAVCTACSGKQGGPASELRA